MTCQQLELIKQKISMHLEVVSPEATLYSGEVSSVTVPGADGEFQMLENHAPIVSLLQEGTVRIKGEEGIAEDFEDYFQKGADGTLLLHIRSGTVELNDNRMIVLAD
jgi:F-type H+-transporting ATPase subunit epsilon